MTHLQHVFLIHHHAVGLLKLFLKHRMQIINMLRVVKTLYVLPHHARLSHSRTYDGACCNQSLIVVATQFPQKPSHGRTLYVETAVGLGVAKQVFHFLVFLKILNTMDIDAHTSVFLYHIHRVFDMSDASLAEDIEFLNTQTLSDIHVPLRRREAFGRHVKSRIARYRVFRYQHAAGMDGAGVGEVEDLLCNINDRTRQRFVLRKAMNLP